MTLVEFGLKETQSRLLTRDPPAGKNQGHTVRIDNDRVLNHDIVAAVGVPSIGVLYLGVVSLYSEPEMKQIYLHLDARVIADGAQVHVTGDNIG